MIGFPAAIRALEHRANAIYEYIILPILPFNKVDDKEGNWDCEDCHGHKNGEHIVIIKRVKTMVPEQGLDVHDGTHSEFQERLDEKADNTVPK